MHNGTHQHFFRLHAHSTCTRVYALSIRHHYPSLSFQSREYPIWPRESTELAVAMHFVLDGRVSANKSRLKFLQKIPSCKFLQVCKFLQEKVLHNTHTLYLGQYPVFSSSIELVLHGPVPWPAVVSPGVPSAIGRRLEEGKTCVRWLWLKHQQIISSAVE